MNAPSSPPAPAPRPPPLRVSFREALGVWVRVAALSFGGPAGQIAVMQRILVEEKGWFSHRRFLHALNYTMLLPGPEAQQLATYGGWMLHGWRGGLVAGGLFILPGFLSILLLSVLYARFQDAALVEGLFFGLKPAVMAIVVQALLRLGSRALTGPHLVAVAGGAFAAIFLFGVAFPWIVVAAALLGILGRWRFDPIPTTNGSTSRSAGASSGACSAEPSSPLLFGDETPTGLLPSGRRALGTAFLWLGIWWLPVLFLFLLFGGSHVLVVESLFFSKVAVVTFGGAYAVLAYIAQAAVDVYGWLLPGEMLDGLGMAETTPGPLIQVVQFVGFMGAYRSPGALDPMAAGVLGSVVTTWVTFAPCFLWIFVGAPYIEYLRGSRLLTRALSAVTAAVVGVILNLALWFGIHTLFQEARPAPAPFDFPLPVWTSLDLGALAIGGVAAFLLFRLRWGMLPVLGVGAILGIGVTLATAL